MGLTAIVRQLRRFARDDSGSMTVYGMFSFVTMGILGATALDVSHLFSARAQLQVVADTAAHAALYSRESNDADTARDDAISMVHAMMDDAFYGEVIRPEDIRFGSYDYESREFAPDDTAQDAVEVVVHRLKADNNAAPSFLFRLLGIGSFDVSARSVYATFRPMCFREGFVADGVVDIQSNNGYSSGFCIHSNTYVSMNSNNTFEPGTVVSMPNTNDIDLPQSGFKTNEGLQAALRSGTYRLRILNRLEEIQSELARYGSPSMPNYITSAESVFLAKNTLTVDDFQAGHIHFASCSGSRLTINPSNTSSTLARVVINTNCEVKFGNGMILEDVILSTTSISSKSINSSSGLQVGRNDHCAPGGGAQLITSGSMDFASDLRMYGGQLLALHDIHFAANANGIEGASMVAGGEIDGTSNMNMGFCNFGMEDNFESNYFRMAD